MTKLLWLDDNIEHYEAIVSFIASKGFEITPAENIKTALAALESEHYDLFLVDIKLAEPDGRDGVQFAIELRENYPETPLVLLSAHLHQSSFRERVADLKFPAGILEKDFEGDLDRLDNTLVQSLRSWSSEAPVLSPSQYYDEVNAAMRSNPFNMGFAEFQRLPEWVRFEIAQSVRKEAADAIEAAFADGNVWVLVCGAKSKVARKEKSITSIPDEETVLDYAKRKRRAYFEFTPDLGSETMSWRGDCGSRDDQSLAGYPTISICYNSNTDLGEEEIVHFDTGTPVTLMDYDNLVDRNVIKPSSRMIYSRRRETGQHFAHTVSKVAFFVRDQKPPHDDVLAEYPIYAVKDWWRCPFIMECDKECNRGTEIGKKQLCKLRAGLIGRDLIFNIGGALVLDGRGTGGTGLSYVWKDQVDVNDG